MIGSDFTTVLRERNLPSEMTLTGLRPDASGRIVDCESTAKPQPQSCDLRNPATRRNRAESAAKKDGGVRSWRGPEARRVLGRFESAAAGQFHALVRGALQADRATEFH